MVDKDDHMGPILYGIRYPEPGPVRLYGSAEEAASRVRAGGIVYEVRHYMIRGRGSGVPVYRVEYCRGMGDPGTWKITRRYGTGTGPLTTEAYSMESGPYIDSTWAADNIHCSDAVAAVSLAMAAWARERSGACAYRGPGEYGDWDAVAGAVRIDFDDAPDRDSATGIAGIEQARAMDRGDG